MNPAESAPHNPTEATPKFQFPLYLLGDPLLSAVDVRVLALIYAFSELDRDGEGEYVGCTLSAPEIGRSTHLDTRTVKASLKRLLEVGAIYKDVTNPNRPIYHPNEEYLGKLNEWISASEDDDIALDASEDEAA